MPSSSSLVLSRNGLRPCGAGLRRGGGGTAFTGAGDCRSVTATDCLLFRAQKILELAHELAHIAERAIHRREADVGDLVQPLQLLHDDGADFLGAHLFLGAILERRFDLVGDALDGRDADGTFFARLEQTGDELLPLEALARAVLLDHHVRDLVDPLVTGEAAAAVEAFAPAADDLPFLALPRVDDLVAEMTAERTLHGCAS